MKLYEFKQKLIGLKEVKFILPNGEKIPAHFHVTEVGSITKHFIDCGGTERKETVVSFQLWEANNYDHRLHPEKLLSIIHLSEEKLGIENDEVEVEYQGETIGKFGIIFSENAFHLTSLTTNCLALDKCGIPPSKIKVPQTKIESKEVCSPGSGCC
ncbi:MAG: DUF6428 family protein [Lishizhenia sp.]